jgi:hypothetical protein
MSILDIKCREPTVAGISAWQPPPAGPARPKFTARHEISSGFSGNEVKIVAAGMKLPEKRRGCPVGPDFIIGHL